MATLTPFSRGAFWCPKTHFGPKFAFWAPKCILGPKNAFWGHFCPLAADAYETNGFCIGFYTFWSQKAKFCPFSHFGPQKCKMSTFSHFGLQKCKMDTFLHIGPIWPPRPAPPEGRPGLGTAGWVRMGEGGRQGLAGQPAVPLAKRRPLSGSGPSARQGRCSSSLLSPQGAYWYHNNIRIISG